MSILTARRGFDIVFPGVFSNSTTILSNVVPRIRTRYAKYQPTYDEVTRRIIYIRRVEKKTHIQPSANPLVIILN